MRYPIVYAEMCQQLKDALLDGTFRKMENPFYKEGDQWYFKYDSICVDLASGVVQFRWGPVVMQELVLNHKLYKTDRLTLTNLDGRNRIKL